MTHATDPPLSAGRRLGELLVAAGHGDAAAFERLYRATSAKLYGICLRIVGRRNDAEDVLQDVYAIVWRKAAQYDIARASAVTWLAMIARNKAIDHVRAGGGERGTSAIDLADELPDPAPSAVDTAESGESRRRLADCLDQLELPRRNLIRVAFFEGATYEELAARCGAPLGTVKSWIRRSLLRLKACLES